MKEVIFYFRIFQLIIILKTDTASFSHLIKGLWSGCPPHGGIALGKTIINSSV